MHQIAKNIHIQGAKIQLLHHVQGKLIHCSASKSDQTQITGTTGEDGDINFCFFPLETETQQLLARISISAFN